MMFHEKIGLAFTGWGKIEIRQVIRHLTVHFLRERRILIEGSETRLHVTDTDLVIEGNKTSRKSRRCVPMDQNHIRFHFFHDWIKFFKDSSRDI